MWHWMTFRKGALTTYYPEETRADYAPRNRGKHVLTQRPDGKPAVHRLQPVRDGVPGEGASRSRRASIPTTRRIPKYPVRFEIDYSRCVFCGLCVEACPEDAIRMVKEVPEPADASTASTCGYRSTELLSWNPQRDVAQAVSAASGAAATGGRMIETVAPRRSSPARRSSPRLLMLVLRHPMRVALALIATHALAGRRLRAARRARDRACSRC